MRARAWCLIVWGALCGAMFLITFVSKVTSGDLFVYLLMAMVLTASILSVKEGRHQLSATSDPRGPGGPSRVVTAHHEPV